MASVSERPGIAVIRVRAMSAASRETVTVALTPGQSTTHHVVMMRFPAYARDVPGGMIVVDGGAGVPADTRVVTAAALAVDESDSPFRALARHLL